MLNFRLVIFLNISVFIIYCITGYIDRDYESLFVLMFIPVLVIRVDIPLDIPGFNVTDAGVHHSGPPISSGSSTSSWDSALRACILDE